MLIDILYCGVCHSDVHQAGDEWAWCVSGPGPNGGEAGRLDGRRGHDAQHRPREGSRRAPAGAHGFALTSDDATFKKFAGHFDLVIDTISAPRDYDRYLGMLKPQRSMVAVGVPPQPTPVNAVSPIVGNRRLAGSLVGGIGETQDVLDCCATHKIVSEVETIPIQKINEPYERMLKADVRYRFVIDIASLEG